MNNFYSEDGLNNEPMDTPEVPQNQEQQGSGVVGDMAQRGSEEVKKQVSKKLKKEVGKKAATSAAGSAASASLMASLSYVLFWVALVILIIFIVIGLIMFFVTMPGMVMEKLKALFEEAGKFIAAFFGADTTQMVKNEEVYATLDYLEQMGWDLKAEGFLTDHYDDDSDLPDSAVTDNGYHLDERTGVFRDDDDKIIAAEADFIFTYMVSDNYVYTIKNGNVATLDEGDNWFVTFLKGAATAIYKIYNAVYGPVFDFLGITEAAGDAWGTGLLAFYYDNGVGVKGTYVNTGSLWNWDSLEIDLKAKKLLITRNELFNNNNAMEFSLDGWTGRYGMPLEFLLAVHKATMMPDLAYDMATSFNTNVNIYLHDVSGEAVAAYKTREDDKYITFEELNEALTGTKAKNIFSQVWSWFDNLSQSDKEVRLASEMGVDHAETCTCEKTTVYGYVIKGTTITAYKRDDGTYYKKVENADGTVSEVDIDLSTNEIEETSDLQYADICSDCKDYLSQVIHIASDNNDYNFKAYSPYIANVTKHWYRDVYFVRSSDDMNFVKYDYDYEAVMKERWTLYETYSKEENEEKAGEFKLYKVNDDGSFGELYDGTYEDAEKENIKVMKKAETIQSSDTDSLADLGWNKNSSGVWTAYKEESGSETGYERLYEDEECGEGVEGEVKRRMYINLKTTGNIVQVGEGQRLETNDDIKKMFLHNTYFRYDGSEETAEIITKLRKEHDLDYGALEEDDLKKKVTIDGEEYVAKDFVANVSLNQDSLNAFSMLENTHTLDSDYIYRDFKELIVELGYFTKEELTDETPRLLQFPVPEIGSAGYPDRSIDKLENEFGTMIHSRGDIESNEINSLRALIAAAGQNVEYGSDELMIDDMTDVVDSENITEVDDEFALMRSIDLAEVGAVNKKLKKPSQVPLTEFLKTTEEMCNTINECGYDYCVRRPVLDENGNKTQPDCTCTEECIAAFPAELCCTCGDECDVVHCAHTVHQNSCDLRASFEASQQSPVGSFNTCCNYLTAWAFINVGIYDTSSPFPIQDMATHLVEDLKGKQINPGEPIKPGDILFYDDYGHVDIAADEGFKFNGGHPAAVGSQKGDGNSSINTFYGWSDGRPPELVIRLNWGKQNDGDYQGYNGNEVVVSPVTGVLLEYGTYDEDDKDGVTDIEYRENADLKYGKDKVNTLITSDEDGLQDPNIVNPTTEEEQEPVIDKVGYAKILVLDAESYKKLEAKVASKWQYDSLVTIKENENQGSEKVTSERNTKSVVYSDVDDFNMDTMEDWTEKDLTIYGYKEFAESYEYAGISGYVVYIDGFVAETPDDSIFFDEESGDDPEEMWKENPSGTKLEMSDFKVSPASLEDYPDDAPQSYYEIDETFKVASKKATEKNEAVAAVKEMAAPAVTVNFDGEELMFIKEGTVLGRTMTDKELIEEIRIEPEEEYEFYRPEDPENEEDKLKAEYMDKVMGNYLRILMRDLDGTVVENVENYMKLDAPAGIYPPQPYVAQPGDLQILVNLMHHEGCAEYFTSLLDGDEEQATAASRVTGYVCINRALVNYGNHGTTISDQIAAPGQYSTADVVLNGPDVTCETCFENAEWCLTYDCMSVSNPSGVQMERNILAQSGWCQGCSPKFSCWWWVDSTGDGQPTEYDGGAFDTFFCANERY